MARTPVWRTQLDSWIQKYEDRMAPRTTIRLYTNVVQIVWEIYGKDLPENPVKWVPRDVRTFWDSISRLKPGTQRTYLVVLLMFLDHCGNTNCKDIRINITPSRINVSWMEEEQVALLLSTAPTISIYAMEVLMAFTGMRREEIRELRNPDLDIKTAKAYQFKLAIQRVWQLSPSLARAYLHKWIRWAERCNLPEMERLAKSIRNHIDGIVESVCQRVTSGIR
ncbi:MAG: transposase [Methanomassiliicoccales archaeon]|jgi:integrase